MEKRLLQALRRRTPDRPPFWFMRQAGRCLPEYQRLREREPDFLRFCYTPELAIEATLQPLRRYAPDAAILFSDILVVPDALGRPVCFIEGKGPVLEPLAVADDVRALRPSHIEDHLAPVFATVRGWPRRCLRTWRSSASPARLGRSRSTWWRAAAAPTAAERAIGRIAIPTDSRP